MPFADKFNEAAQNAILRKIDADQWEQLPWLARLVQQQVTIAVKEWDKIEGNPLAVSLPEEMQEQQPIDCRHMSEADIEKLIGVKPAVLRSVMATESASPEAIEAWAQKASEAIEAAQPAAERTQTQPSEPGHKDSFESNDFGHGEGYDWRIIVADRLKNCNNSWAEHFNYRPSQEEFEHQYRHFEARTHHVHVNQWVDGDWITITPDYAPQLNKEKPAESFTTTSDWEDGKGWLIRYWDQRVDRVNYVYFDYKPGGITLHKYHSAKGFAVVEKRPEGV